MGASGNDKRPSPYRRPNIRSRWGPGQHERHERDKKCVEMKIAGHSWDSIVETLGYASSGHARDRYKLFLERMPPREDLEEQRELEMARLDRMMTKLEPKLNGDQAVRAVEVMIKLMERRARLAGFDMPVKSQLTVINDDLAKELVMEWRKGIDAKRQAAIAAGISLGEVVEGEVVKEEVTPRDKRRRA